MAPVRATVFEGTRIGVEALATPGTPVPAIRDLGALSFVATPAPETKNFTPNGSMIPTSGVLVKEQTTYKLDGMGTYNELQYALSGVLTDPVITTPAGGTLTRLWTWALNTNAPNTARSFSGEKGTDLLGASHYTGIQMTDFTFGFTRDGEVKLGGSAFGQPTANDLVRWLTIVGTAGTFTFTVGANTTAALPYNITAAALDTALEGLASVGANKVIVTGGPGATGGLRILFDKSVSLTTVSVNGALVTGPGAAVNLTRLSPGATQLALMPISPSEIDIYAATTWAGLDTAETTNNALPLPFKFDWGVTGRHSPYFPLNTSNGTGFGGVNETTPKSSISFDVGADALMTSFINNVRAQDLIFLRVRARGPLIEGTLYNQLKIDTALRLGTISEDKDVSGGGLLGKTFTGEWMRDPTTGRGSIVTLQNTQTAL